MKLGFLSLPHEERRLYFAQAAARKNLSAVILEKDFWVCWLLGILFRSEFASSLVFKGGTSLSKVFGVIDRFSEDIDLSISPNFLRMPEAGPSRNQANKWMARAETACGIAVKTQIAPALEQAARNALGRPSDLWFEYHTDLSTNSPVLLFHYPSTEPKGFDYLKRSVKLEFGSLTDQQPTGRHSIWPWIAETLPTAFPDWQCEVVALEIKRTFWEKATILHMEFHRPLTKPMPDRFARHYADMASLAMNKAAREAVNDRELCSRVVRWKSRYFGSSWANYDDAKPGTFRLVPPSGRLPALRADYQAMRAMYLSEPMSLDAILATLAILEADINGKSHLESGARS